MTESLFGVDTARAKPATKRTKVAKDVDGRPLRASGYAQTERPGPYLPNPDLLSLAEIQDRLARLYPNVAVDLVSSFPGEPAVAGTITGRPFAIHARPGETLTDCLRRFVKERRAA